MLKFIKRAWRSAEGGSGHAIENVRLDEDDVTIFARRTAAGVRVSGANVMTSPTAAAAIRAIAFTAGGLPLHLYRRGADGERERDTTHPANRLLADRANPWTSSEDLRVGLLLDALRHGRGLAVAVRLRGKVTELHRVPWGAFTVKVDPTTLEPSYTVTPKQGSPIVYSFRDVVDVMPPGSMPDAPVNLTMEGREAIALDIALSRYFSSLLGKGARPGSVMEAASGAEVSPAQAKKALALLREVSAGDRSGETAFIPPPFKFTPITFSSVDLQFAEMVKAVKGEIARIYNVPPTLLQDYERAVWRNLEESLTGWLSLGLKPWLEVLQFAFSRVLIADRERDALFLEHVTADLLRPNTAALYAALKTATGTPFLTPNEARRLGLNLGPAPGGDELVRQAGQTGAADPTPPNPDNQDTQSDAGTDRKQP